MTATSVGGLGYPTWRLKARVAAFLPALFCLTSAVLLFPASGSDDAYLTYWPAETLAERGAILNYNGERIEQSSSLLLVALFAILSLPGQAELSDLARAASLIAAITTLWAVGRGALGILHDPRSKLVAGALIATAPSFVYWSTSGMEPSFTALFVVTTAGMFNHVLTKGPGSPWRLAGMVGSTCALLLIRPESFVVLLLITSVLVASPWLGRVFPRARFFALIEPRPARILLSTVAAATAAMIGWRLWYFGVPVPQPVLAKAGLDGHRALRGLSYLFEAEHAFWLPTLVTGLLAAGLLLLRPDGQRSRLLSSYVLALFGFALGSFVVLSGGDWMELGRFLVPLIPVCALLIASLLEHLPEHGTLRRGLPWMIAAALFANGWGLVTAPGSGSLRLWQGGAGSGGVEVDRYTWLERTNKPNRRDMGAVDFLRALLGGPFASRERVSLMSHQGGFMPYTLAREHGGSLVFTEPNGLYDRSLLDCRYARGRYTATAYGRSLRGTPVGRIMGELLSETLPRCGLPQPDIVYALPLPPPEVLPQLGYRLVYRGNGWIAVHDPARAASPPPLTPCPRYGAHCDATILDERS